MKSIQIYKEVDSAIQVGLLLGWIILICGGEFGVLGYPIVGAYQLSSAIVHRNYYSAAEKARDWMEKALFAIAAFWLLALLVGGLNLLSPNNGISKVFGIPLGVGMITQAVLAPFFAIYYCVQCVRETFYMNSKPDQLL